MTRVAVVMAGGSGERFWPLSRKRHPKQLLALSSSGKTMLEEAVSRVAPMIPNNQIYIQTSPELLDPIRAVDMGIPRENVIAEPCRRNTAGCLAYAASHMLAQYGGTGEAISMAIVTADHHIAPETAFRDTIEQALSAAEAAPVLATIGIPPTRPATGFGYIQADPVDGSGIHAVRAFHEKPDVVTAQAYLDAGNYYWNSGMFFWRVSSFVDELRGAGSSLADAVLQMAAAMRQGNSKAAEKIFESIESLSIDYALMEKAKRVVMIPAAFSWDDIGTWAALERSTEPDAQGNSVHGDSVLIDSKGCVVYNGATPGAVAVSVIGVEGLVVVATGDAVLVVPKERAEEVKLAVQELARRNASQL